MSSIYSHLLRNALQMSMNVSSVKPDFHIQETGWGFLNILK